MEAELTAPENLLAGEVTHDFSCPKATGNWVAEAVKPWTPSLQPEVSMIPAPALRLTVAGPCP